jgi:hypothetical protein
MYYLIEIGTSPILFMDYIIVCAFRYIYRMKLSYFNMYEIWAPHKNYMVL